MKETGPGTLIVAAAPIGRPEDASPRLASALAGAAVVAAEDTRRVRRLAERRSRHDERAAVFHPATTVGHCAMPAPGAAHTMCLDDGNSG